MSGKIYCFFTSHYLPYLGGVERYTYNLAKELVNRGNRVIIVTSQMEGEKSYSDNDNIVVVRLDSIPLINDRFPILKMTKHNRELIDKIKKEKIDYIVVNTRFYFITLFGVLFAKKNGIPAAVIEHGTGHFTVNNKILDICGQLYEHFISWLVKKNCCQFYGVSLACNEWLKHFKINANGVLYNSIDLEEIRSKIDSYKMDNLFEYNEHDFIITYTGRLIEEKGIFKLIDAVCKLHEKYRNVKLCIAGDGDLYPELMKHQNDFIYLLGRLKFDDVIGLLKYTDVYCLPTDYPEGLPTSVLEAIACGVYVVTTESGGSKEVIIDNSYGTILKENSVEEIYKVLEYLIRNEIEKKKAARRAYERVEQNFTWKVTTDSLINIFE